MKIKNNKLYILDIDEVKEAYNNEEEAIKKMKNSVSDDTDPENVKIFEVDISKDEWSIKQIPWSKIAIEMMKKEE